MRAIARDLIEGVSTATIRVQGTRVRYVSAGQGEPVVLVHGLAGSTHWWLRNLHVLARRYRVYALDLPGFGAMGWPALGWPAAGGRSRFVLGEAASWLRAWMRAVGLRHAHLVGHSMGGYIAMRLAAVHPELVRRLALVAPAGVPMGRSLLGKAWPLALAAARTAPTFLPLLAYDALRAGPLTLARAGYELLAQDVREEAQRIQAPTLLLWGRRDPLVPPALGEALRQHIPNARLLYLERAGHVPMYERPRQFNTALLGFLDGAAVGA
ncbi:MAG TPA: alpha/beta fold hydrolase [Ktedonobacterales bacterium]